MSTSCVLFVLNLLLLFLGANVDATTVTTSCTPTLTNRLYGYNVSCIFSITALTSYDIHFVELNWTLPSQPQWNYD